MFAFAGEIDAWLKASGNEQPTERAVPPPESPSPAPETPRDEPPRDKPPSRARQWIVASATVAAILAVALAWRLGTPGVDASELRIQVTKQGVVAADAADAVVWRYPFDPAYSVAVTDYGNPWRLVRGRHGAVYATTAYKIRNDTQVAEGGELLQLGLDGTLKRSFTFDDQVTVGGRHYEPPWVVTDFAVLENPAGSRIVLAGHHYQWSASPITILDAEWKRAATFVHNGWIEWVYWLSPDRILIGGFSDDRNGGLVGLLDASGGTLKPARMIVMPRSELNRVTASRFNRAIVERIGERISARTIEIPETEHEATDVLYEFTPALELIRASVSAKYWDEHRALELEHKLDHSKDSCPDRYGPPGVEVWTPEGGWQPLPTADGRARGTR